jgi:hypothetical protein
MHIAARVAQWLERRRENLVRPRFEFHCRTWVSVLRRRPYKPRFRVAVGVWHEKELSLLKAMSAKHRSKFAALSAVMVIAAG